METATTARKASAASNLRLEGCVPLKFSCDGKPFQAQLYFASVAVYRRILPIANEILTGTDWRRFQGLRHSYQQSGYLLGRYACREAAAHYLQEPDKDGIRIAPGVFGQPVVKCLASEAPEIAMAYTSELAMAIAYPPGFIIGLDLERLDSGNREGISDVILAEEAAAFASLFPSEAHFRKTILTIKEAFSKAIKCGRDFQAGALRIERIFPREDSVYLAYFANFPRFKSVSYLFGEYVISVAIPFNLEPNLDFSSLLHDAPALVDGVRKPLAVSEGAR